MQEAPVSLGKSVLLIPRRESDGSWGGPLIQMALDDMYSEEGFYACTADAGGDEIYSVDSLLFYIPNLPIIFPTC